MLRPGTPSTKKPPGQGLHPEKGSPTKPTLNEKRSQDTGQTNLETTQTSSSGSKTYNSSGQNAAAHNRDAQRVVRTVPAWVRTIDEDDENLHEIAQLLPHIPPDIQIAQHNHSPSSVPKLKPDPPRGRLYDHQRERIPPLPSGSVRETGSRWKAFTDASAYPAITAEGGEIVTEEWLIQNGPDYSRPWLAGEHEGGDPEKGIRLFRVKRRAWYIRVQRTVLRNPLVPMIIRLNVFSFSALALGLASVIHHETDKENNKAQETPSTNMAIIVDAIAMVYLLYITYDEYSGKPLGLRSASAKMRLILLDLFFIVFDSANLSLSFEAVEGEACQRAAGYKEDHICNLQRGLASVLFVALVAWLLTFAISVLR